MYPGKGKGDLGRKLDARGERLDTRDKTQDI
jgi:hypothetical protein